ncbi:MAG: hypothetical protein HC859_11705 [Bacteroidia bacterium]|nr:hypothetical protein [Bacteroidia bacterium]
MNRVLILGAGRSSSSLIQYLMQHAPDFDGELVVGDMDVQAARGAVGGQANARAVAFDMRDGESSKSMIASAGVVISMLPPHLHPAVARMCLDAGRHLLTASYVSKEMKAFDADAAARRASVSQRMRPDPASTT